MRRGLAIGWLVALLAAAVLAEEAPVGAEAADAEGSAAGGDTASEAEEAAPAIDLDALLARLRETVAAERQQDRAREEAFQRARDEQAEALRDTEAQVRAEEQQSLSLDTRYGENELEIERLGERLTDRLGQMGELFGVVRLVSTDLSAQTWESLTSAGLENRTELLDRLGRSTDLPSTEDLERLWFELQREMTEQGRIVRDTLPVIGKIERDGTPKEFAEKDVVRVGAFTAFTPDGYVRWRRDAQKLRALDRQPPPRYLNSVEAYLEAGADAGFRRVAVDPSRGVLLEALTDTPSLLERVEQGGYVGYTIIGLGLFALALGLARLTVLTITGRRVEEQAHSDRPRPDNPLGRVLGVYEQNRALDYEVLEQRLDEVVLRESAGVERHMWVVQTISIIAPLLGLLGTVTGMIQTFQAITLFGAGDPKMMAGGISEALVTTTLGLITAIPLVLLYALLSSRTRRITDLLDERSAALLASRLARGTPA